MTRSIRSLRFLFLATSLSLAAISGLPGCRALQEPAESGFRERDANWGASYRSTNEFDRGTGLHHKGREVERSLGYQ